MPLTKVIIRKSALVGEYFIDGKPVSRVEENQVCEMDSEYAKQAIERGLVEPFETPEVSYEVTMFEPKVRSIDIETKEEDRLRVLDEPIAFECIRLPEPSPEALAAFERGIVSPGPPFGDGDLPDEEPAGVAPQSSEELPSSDVPELRASDSGVRHGRAVRRRRGA